MLRTLLCFYGVLAATSLSPVTDLNTTQYYGRWYQAFSDLAVEATFENNSYCVTADYAPNPNGTISVDNRERNDNVTGPMRRILGWADVPDPSKPGQLQVHLQTTEFAAPYWVYALGPVVNGLYDYSVVSDNLRFTLFVLTRNLTRFARDYNTQVLSFLNASGFTRLWNFPVATVQGGCRYWA
jgi:lipocalin